MKVGSGSDAREDECNVVWDVRIAIRQPAVGDRDGEFGGQGTGDINVSQAFA